MSYMYSTYTWVDCLAKAILQAIRIVAEYKSVDEKRSWGNGMYISKLSGDDVYRFKCFDNLT
jgi:hypothetical protein